MSGERDILSPRWLAGGLASILIMGGAGWMTYVQAQLSDVKKEQQAESQMRGKQTSDLEVIREKVKRLEEDTREIKGDVKDQNKKLDELLRRSR